MASSPSSNQSDLNKINAFYANYKHISEFIGKSHDTEAPTLEDDVEKLTVKENRTKEDKVDAFCKEFLYIGGPEVIERSSKKKDVKQATSKQHAGITDQVAKESSDSNASTHQHHDVDTGASSGGNAHAQAHKANLGPVHADNLPTPESKDDLKKRAEELNK
ncbi:hypothetical protein EJ02DRAFT_352898 [Clathrospora elynae]|uniref:Uncharacterized protein n=1 Tax=Clathrospora elynae TaxID=706981 RepID=A0A6A5SEW6_9PLEO|nr:hypothetical protein EJ02DRAFT_352898 [Clathrospora elynae]